jgi:hypothetical protein
MMFRFVQLRGPASERDCCAGNAAFQPLVRRQSVTQ